MNMDAQGHEANPKLEGEASPSPRGRPGRRGAEEKTQAVLELLSGKTAIDFLARRFGVREQTAEQWREDFDPAGGESVAQSS